MSMVDFLRGDKTIDPNRARDTGGVITELRGKKSFAVQCNECGKWRKIQSSSLSAYKFECFFCGKKGQMKSRNFYEFNFRELPLGTNHDIYIKKLNDEVR